MSVYYKDLTFKPDSHATADQTICKSLRFHGFRTLQLDPPSQTTFTLMSLSHPGAQVLFASLVSAQIDGLSQ